MAKMLQMMIRTTHLNKGVDKLRKISKKLQTLAMPIKIKLVKRPGNQQKGNKTRYTVKEYP